MIVAMRISCALIAGALLLLLASRFFGSSHSNAAALSSSVTARDKAAALLNSVVAVSDGSHKRLSDAATKLGCCPFSGLPYDAPLSSGTPRPRKMAFMLGAQKSGAFARSIDVAMQNRSRE